jgi:bifunctional aspartokinase / homoserine dehydrogenase 1
MVVESVVKRLRVVSVGVIGEGVVGSALLTQIRDAADSLFRTHGLRLHVVAVARSTAMSLGDPVDLEAWRSKALDRQPLDLDLLAAHVLSKAPDQGRAVLCDCTASATVATLYATWLRKGIHVVTANKKASSGPAELYLDIVQAQIDGDAQLCHEATVGAGLPIISTIRDLLRTGDTILQVEGILSGTLSFIFNELNESAAFSDVVKRAKLKGFTEPDPRDDLSGTDVARKVVILAREVGIDVNLSDVSVKNMVPHALRGNEVSAAQFIERLGDFDTELKNLAVDAMRNGNVLRYVGVVNVSSGLCSVELRQYPKSHPFGGLQLADNILTITSRRYSPQPLVVQGPGAGAEVTAGQVFAEVLHLSL